MKSLKLMVAAMALCAYAQAQNFWTAVNESSIRQQGKRQIVPQKYLTFALNMADMKNKLFAAPHEKSVGINNSACIIALPLPNGAVQNFRIVESPVMAAELSASFPDIKTFSVKGIDDPYAKGKLDWSDKYGFHGMVRTPNGDFFIDPYCLNNINNYITYYTADFVKNPADVFPEAGLIEDEEIQGQKKPASSQQQTGSNTANKIAAGAVCVGSQLRKYRLAIGCTGQYAVAATGLSNPTTADVLAKVVTSVNRVDGVYESEVAIRLELVPTTTLTLYLQTATTSVIAPAPSATAQPYKGNNNSGLLIAESQSVITNIIGSSNFDMGHTFSTGDGGLANLGCVCKNNSKASGITGSGNPVGDPYDIDYVAHEMGHQFSGNHTFNANTGSCSGNRNASTSVEPGSGVTIMAYAGICSANDLAQHSIAYFHAISYDEIVNYSNSGTGNSCPTIINTGNNPPTVIGAGSYTIPASTPFSLTGSATDPDGDDLTYSWEETDAGTASGNWNSGNRPYFRSYAPVTSPTRLFPASTQALNGSFTTTKGEYLPSSAQTLHFRLTARDNRANGGGVCYDYSDVTLTAGSFSLTYPSATGIVWGMNSQKTITWDVSGSNASPVDCESVKIYISYNSGNTYSVLVASTPNDGVETITVPTVTADISTCRIRVESIGNIFYDVSNNNFKISTTLENVDDVGIRQISQNDPVGLSVFPNPFGNQINFAVSNLNSASNTKVIVQDILGKTVLQNSYDRKTELKESLDLSGLSHGVYFIKVSNDNRQSVYRIVKE